MKKHLLVSFSGGRSSAMMARLVQVSPIYDEFEKVYIFANTGKEREETLKFIQQCDDLWKFGVKWIEAVINPAKGEGTSFRYVDYNSALRNTDEMKQGHPFFDLCKKYGCPSNSAPHCTKELKTKSIHECLKSLGIKNPLQAWGIRFDEPKRLKKRANVIYPLADARITEEMVRVFWDRQGFDLGLKDYEGNCDLCFKKSLRKRVTIMRENPELAQAWAAMEGNQPYGKGRVGDLVFDRHGLSILDIQKLAEDQSFDLAKDKHEERKKFIAKQPELFEVFKDVDFDFETTCHCDAS